jgi:hypothetical protein
MNGIMKESKKMWNCPLNDFECPYCDENGVCWLDDPMTDCDDFYAAVGDDKYE